MMKELKRTSLFTFLKYWIKEMKNEFKRASLFTFFEKYVPGLKSEKLDSTSFSNDPKIEDPALFGCSKFSLSSLSI